MASSQDAGTRGCAGHHRPHDRARRLGHTLPYLIPHFWTQTGVAAVVVLIELWLIAWIRARYMDTAFLRAASEVVIGGFSFSLSASSSAAPEPGTTPLCIKVAHRSDGRATVRPHPHIFCSESLFSKYQKGLILERVLTLVTRLPLTSDEVLASSLL